MRKSILILSVTLGTVSCSEFNKKPKDPARVAGTAIETPWHRVEFGHLGLSAEVPFTGTPKTIELDREAPGIKERLEDIAAFEYSSDKRLYFSANSIKYRPNITITEERSIDASINELANAWKAQVSNRKNKIIQVGENQFKVSEMTLSSPNNPDRNMIIGVCLLDKTLYQLAAVFALTDKTGFEKYDRILRSVKIELPQ